MSDPASPVTTVHRLAILQPGGPLSRSGKTGLSLLRYAEHKIVALIDAEHAGRSTRELSGLPLVRDIPIVATMQDALRHSPQAVAIGCAPLGGRLPDAWRPELRVAVRAGVSVWNGLHTRLADDPEIAAALRPGVHVWDMRCEPQNLVNGTGRARDLTCRRVLFVGTDMAIGKMTAALEFDRACRERGLRSRFIATGQTGMMIAGDGVCVDAVRVDFASGAVETEVLRHGAQHDCLWIEGQGSLLNPASTATLPLIRGSQPTDLVLVHRAGMTHLQDFPGIPVPPLPRVIALYEMVAEAAGAFPLARVAGVALNTRGLSDEAARDAVAETITATGLPCTDAVRFGVGPILDTLLHR